MGKQWNGENTDWSIANNPTDENGTWTVLLTSPDVTGEYLRVAQKRGIFKVSALQLEQFRKELQVAVVGDKRAADVASSTKRNSGYAMEVSTARAFGALQDYRANGGLNQDTLLLAKQRPALEKE